MIGTAFNDNTVIIVIHSVVNDSVIGGRTKTIVFVVIGNADAGIFVAIDFIIFYSDVMGHIEQDPIAGAHGNPVFIGIDDVAFN